MANLDYNDAINQLVADGNALAGTPPIAIGAHALIRKDGTIVQLADSSPLDAKGYGAKGDTATLTNGAMSSGSALLTSTGAAFTSADVGKVIFVSGAGAPGTPGLGSTIASVVSATSVMLASPNASGGVVSAATVYYGTDDSVAMQAAIAAAVAASRTLYVPPGYYCLHVSLATGLRMRLDPAATLDWYGSGNPCTLNDFAGVATNVVIDGWGVIKGTLTAGMFLSSASKLSIHVKDMSGANTAISTATAAELHITAEAVRNIQLGSGSQLYITCEQLGALGVNGDSTNAWVHGNLGRYQSEIFGFGAFVAASNSRLYVWGDLKASSGGIQMTGVLSRTSQAYIWGDCVGTDSGVNIEWGYVEVWGNAWSDNTASTYNMVGRGSGVCNARGTAIIHGNVYGMIPLVNGNGTTTVFGDVYVSTALTTFAADGGDNTVGGFGGDIIATTGSFTRSGNTVTATGTMSASGFPTVLRPFTAQDIGTNLQYNLRAVTDGGTTSGSKNVTSATAAFTASDVGRSILIQSFNNIRADVIASVTNSTTVVVTGANLGFAASNCRLDICDRLYVTSVNSAGTAATGTYTGNASALGPVSTVQMYVANANLVGYFVPGLNSKVSSGPDNDSIGGCAIYSTMVGGNVRVTGKVTSIGGPAVRLEGGTVEVSGAIESTSAGATGYAVRGGSGTLVLRAATLTAGAGVSDVLQGAASLQNPTPSLAVSLFCEAYANKGVAAPANVVFGASGRYNITGFSYDKSNTGYFEAYQSPGQSIPNATPTLLTFQNETSDVYNRFSSTTYTAEVAGLYYFQVGVTTGVSQLFGSGTGLSLLFKKNGTIVRNLVKPTVSVTTVIATMAEARMQLAAGDTITVELNHFQGTAVTLEPGSAYTWFLGSRIP